MSTVNNKPMFSALASRIVDPAECASEALTALAAVHHGVRRKSPSKKLDSTLDIEADLVFEDPDNARVVKTWARRVLARQFPQALSLNEDMLQRISTAAKMLSKLVAQTDDEKADMLTQIGGLVVRNMIGKYDQRIDRIRLKLKQQELTTQTPTTFTAQSPSRILKDIAAPHPVDRIERTSTRQGGR